MTPSCAGPSTKRCPSCPAAAGAHGPGGEGAGTGARAPGLGRARALSPCALVAPLPQGDAARPPGRAPVKGRALLRWERRETGGWEAWGRGRHRTGAQSRMRGGFSGRGRSLAWSGVQMCWMHLANPGGGASPWRSAQSRGPGVRGQKMSQWTVTGRGCGGGEAGSRCPSGLSS